MSAFLSLNEELRIVDIDDKTLNTIKVNFLTRLEEYREYVLSNINYNALTNKIEYIDFKQIDIPVILRELNNEFTEEFIEEINVKTFLEKINQLMILKKRNTKREIRNAFVEYIKSIGDRIHQIKTITDDEFFDMIEGEKSIIGKKQFNNEKYKIQIELLKLQEWVIKNKKRIAIVFEGRDAAGKGSTIKTFTEYLNPSGFKIKTFGVPTEEERKNWFKRYEANLPKPGEIVFFDRSWYNRAVIEPAMGYCTEEEYRKFMDEVVDWEEDLIRDGIILIKFWFSITKEKQLQRFELRKNSPLKYWKFSENDSKTTKKWDIISNYKLQMFMKTSSSKSPWVIINSNDKKIGKLNAMRYVLSIVNYDDKDTSVCRYYPEVVNVV